LSFDGNYFTYEHFDTDSGSAPAVYSGIWKGWQLDVKISTTMNDLTGSTISAPSIHAIKAISHGIDHKLISNRGVGERFIKHVTEGVMDLSGNIERFWTGSSTEAWTRGTNEIGELTTYYIGIYPGGAVSGQPYIILEEIKFGSSSKSFRPGSKLMIESIPFTGKQVRDGLVNLS